MTQILGNVCDHIFAKCKRENFIKTKLRILWQPSPVSPIASYELTGLLREYTWKITSYNGSLCIRMDQSSSQSITNLVIQSFVAHKICSPAYKIGRYGWSLKIIKKNIVIQRLCSYIFHIYRLVLTINISFKITTLIYRIIWLS